MAAKKFKLTDNQTFIDEMLKGAAMGYPKEGAMAYPEREAIKITSLPTPKDIALYLGRNETEREDTTPRRMRLTNARLPSYLIANPETLSTFESARNDAKSSPGRAAFSSTRLSQSTAALGHFMVPVFGEITVKRTGTKLVFNLAKSHIIPVDGFDFDEGDFLGDWSLGEGLHHFWTLWYKLIGKAYERKDEKYIPPAFKAKVGILFDNHFKAFRETFKPVYNEAIKGTYHEQSRKLSCTDFGVVTEAIPLELGNKTWEIDIPQPQ